jgi:hypothetical protein
MAESIASEIVRRSTAHASLAALGVKLCQLDLLAPIRSGVKIHQKTVQYTPFDKLYDCFIGILAGAHGIVEINLGLRADPALQAAFGRPACAEQSVIQDTLDACSSTNVAEIEAAVDAIYRAYSRAYAHNYTQEFQILDADITGMPCGKKAAFATKGYFAKQKNRRGRQLGRVLATRYDEVVVDRLFAGTVQLREALRPLVEAAEETLSLTEEKRKRTILRVDAGAGTLVQVNWALERGYEFHGREYHAGRSQKLAATVATWMEDPRLPERQVGWVEAPATEYSRPVRRLAVRSRKANGEWGVGVLISTLTPATVLFLTGEPIERMDDPVAVMLAYVYFYDQRGGGVETSVKGDKQGLGITKRNKKRFEAQQMLVQLGALAHNVLVWARSWLAPMVPAVKRLGIKRLVRDVFRVSGVVETDRTGQVCRIVLNQANRLAHRFLTAFQLLAGPAQVPVILGET